MFTGKVTSTQAPKIRKSYPSGTQLGLLQFNDLVEATVIESGWWRLSKITRGTNVIALPGPVCWVNGEFILDTTVTSPQLNVEPQITNIAGTSNDATTQATVPNSVPPANGVFKKMLRLFDVEGTNDQGDTDQIGVCWTQNAGNCSGIQNFFWLDDQRERELVRRVNTGIDAIPWTEKLHWAVWDKAGGIYRADQRNDMTIPWKDTSLVMGSRSALAGEYNQVSVLQTAGGYTDIETIPVLDSYDHLSVATHPWLFHRIYVTNAIGKTFETPHGIFYKPLFSPIGRRRAAGDITGFWVRNQFLGESI
jgi:hypothetical protein